MCVRVHMYVCVCAHSCGCMPVSMGACVTRHCHFSDVYINPAFCPEVIVLDTMGGFQGLHCAIVIWLSVIVEGNT